MEMHLLETEEKFLQCERSASYDQIQQLWAPAGLQRYMVRSELTRKL